MKQTLLISFSLLGFAIAAGAQATAPYNSIGGVVWIDADSNNVRNAEEKRVPGILVTLVSTANDSTVSSALSDADGVFTLSNYAGAGDYYLNYVYPSAGFVPVTMRAGTENSVNSAADATTVGYVDEYTVSTPPFTISDNSDLTSFGLGLHRIETTLTYWASQPMTSTSWSRTFRLPKSNNNTATASRATILVTEAVLHPVIGFENTGAGADGGEIEGSGRITLSLPAGSMSQLTSRVSKSVVFAPFDGVEDYDGTSGYSWQHSQGATHEAVSIINPTQLTNGYRSAAYRDSLSITASAVSSTTITGSANLKASISTISGAGVFITYRYPASVPLPLKSGSFSGRRDGNAAVLSWEAASQTAGQRFIIERSLEGRAFEAIGEVYPQAAGRALSSYTFRDDRPAQCLNYYRLKTAGADGSAAYSPVVALAFGAAAAPVQAFPNPAASSLTVRGNTGSRFELLDALGRAVAAGTLPESGLARLQVASFPSGVYTLRVEDESQPQPATQRIVIQHP